VAFCLINICCANDLSYSTLNGASETFLSFKTFVIGILSTLTSTFGRTVLRTQTKRLNTSAILKVFCLSFYMTVGTVNHSGLHNALGSKTFDIFVIVI
jgi:hypothetical protein